MIAGLQVLFFRLMTAYFFRSIVRKWLRTRHMQPSFYAIAASTVRFFPGLSLLVAVQVRHITMSSKRVFFRGPFFFFFFSGDIRA